MAEAKNEHDYLVLGEIQDELLSMLKIAGPWFNEHGVIYARYFSKVACCLQIDLS